MIKKNYIIQTYRNPIHLHRLVNKLNDGFSVFYIHIDLKTNITEYCSALAYPNVHFIKERVDCIWGDYSQVQASLNLIANVLKNENEGYTILLSGQDYPIKNTTHINNYIENNCSYNFIDAHLFNETWRNFNDRAIKYCFNHSSRRGDFSLYKNFKNSSFKEIQKAVLDLLRLKISIKEFAKLFSSRKFTLTNNQYSGSSWWAFNYETTTKIYSFVKEHKKELVNYYKYNLVSDEIFYQTILMHLSNTDSSIKIKPSITYVNWERKNCPLPVTFNKDDFDELSNQPEYKLFARKFDENYCDEILDLLDASMNNQ